MPTSIKREISKLSDRDLLMAYMPAGFEGAVVQAAHNVEKAVDSVIDDYEKELESIVSGLADDASILALRAEIEEKTGQISKTLDEKKKALETLQKESKDVIAALDGVNQNQESLKAISKELEKHVNALKTIHNELADTSRNMGNTLVKTGIVGLKKAIGLP